MDFNTFKNYVIAAAKAQGIEEYELYYQASESVSVGVFKHEINEFSSSVEGGVCFRCIVYGHMGYASTEELSAASAADVVARAADNARILETEEPEFLVEGGQTYEPLDIKPYDLPAPAQLVETVLKTEQALYAADPAVIDGSSASASTDKRTIAIVNSKGLDLHYENNVSLVMAEAVVSDGNEMTNAYKAKAGSFAELDLAELVKEPVADAKAQLGADVAPTGAYPVVFAPKAMAGLLRTFASCFSSESTQRGLSLLDGKEGETIAAPIVTLVDDPFYPESQTPINFDAEGSPAVKKNVVESGVLTTLLYNLKTAAVAGRKTTGNAAKAGYNATVTVRPFTMYLAPGDLSEEELLKKAGNGVYIDSLGGMHAGANVISGDFSLQSGGFMIENGEKTTPVKSFTVAGNFYSLLKQITAIADKVELPGFGGITAFGSPAVLVEGLTIAGK